MRVKWERGRWREMKGRGIPRGSPWEWTRAVFLYLFAGEHRARLLGQQRIDFSNSKAGL